MEATLTTGPRLLRHESSEGGWPGMRVPEARAHCPGCCGKSRGSGVLILAAGAAFLWYENNRIHRVDVKHLATVQARGAQKDVQNILLIGSTTRCGLKEQSSAFGLCDQGVTGVNSDVVMILHLDPDHHRASILSIPRDTFVPTPDLTE